MRFIEGGRGRGGGTPPLLRFCRSLPLVSPAIPPLIKPIHCSLYGERFRSKFGYEAKTSANERSFFPNELRSKEFLFPPPLFVYANSFSRDEITIQRLRKRFFLSYAGIYFRMDISREISEGAAKGISTNIGLGSLNILKMRLKIIISYIGITNVGIVEITFSGI